MKHTTYNIHLIQYTWSCGVPPLYAFTADACGWATHHILPQATPCPLHCSRYSSAPLPLWYNGVNWRWRWCQRAFQRQLWLRRRRRRRRWGQCRACTAAHSLDRRPKGRYGGAPIGHGGRAGEAVCRGSCHSIATKTGGSAARTGHEAHGYAPKHLAVHEHVARP
jgi:hypothetical protein